MCDERGRRWTWVGGSGARIVPSAQWPWLVTAFAALLLGLLGLSPARAQPLVSPELLAKRALSPVGESERVAVEAAVHGSWKRVGYRLFDRKSQVYVDVPVPKDPIDATVETWLFRTHHSFRHQMNERLFFTGKWRIDQRLGPLQLGTGPPPAPGAKPAPGHFAGYALLHTTEVQTSFVKRRPHDYFVLCFTDGGRRLVVFYVGTELRLSPAPFAQGHVFERRPYGER